MKKIKETFNLMFADSSLVNGYSELVSLVLSLTVVFVLTFSSVFAILSLQSYEKQLENKNQIIVYLNDIDNESKKEFSKKLLEIPGVSSARYESKELALKAVILDLGVSLPEGENPLNDAFYVYLKKDVNLKEVKDILVNMGEINAVDIRTNAIEKSLEFNSKIESISYKAMIMMGLFTVLMIYNIIKFSIIGKKKEIHGAIEKGTGVGTIKNVFFMENILVITLSYLLALGIYRYIKVQLLDSLSILTENIFVFTVDYKTVISMLVIYILSILISLLINYVVINRYFDECLEERL